jgi:CNT family concentrative nucleoside transporter
MVVLQSLLGVVILPAIAWLLAGCARLDAATAFRIALTGLGLQFVVAGLFLVVPGLAGVFMLLGRGVAGLQAATLEGVRFVFGYLAGGPAPFAVTAPENGFVLALQALPLILVVSVLSRLLYHWGVLQRVVAAIAWVLQRSMGIGGALGTATAANVFVGMVEAPLLVRPYLAAMSRADLFGVMTAGMATVAGTVMVIYASLLEPVVPGAAGHILIASLISAPAALTMARLMMPPAMSNGSEPEARSAPLALHAGSAMDAIAEGTADGLKLLANVVAMLVVMVALVALVNLLLALLPEMGGAPLSVERMAGWIAAPLVWAIGIPWSEAHAAGQIFGIKTVLNEFIAYVKLAGSAETLSERSRLIMTYALCGFANFGSLGIMTGGLVSMCPDRRSDILALGPLTILSGSLATLLTGAVVGVLVWP